MKTATAALLAGLLLAPGMATADKPKVTPADNRPQESVNYFFVDESRLPFESLPGTTTTTLWGVHKNAGYRMEVPSNWNGDLVVYAHGFRGNLETPELTVSNPAIRRHLIENGYAWAASSYSKNRYDIQAGVLDTQAVTKLFQSQVGRPDRIYLTGHSMGGHVIGALIEQYPNLYDGASPKCGVMGDFELYDFFFDWILLSQAIVGIDAQWPDTDFTTTVLPELMPQLGASPPFVLNENGEKLKTAAKFLSGGERPLYDTAILAWWNFLFDRFGDRDGTQSGISVAPTYDNSERVYQLDGDPDMSPEEMVLNQNILRVTAPPQARPMNGLNNIVPISGDLPIPVLTLHTLGDLFVPFSMQQIYAREAAAHGKSDLLVQRAIRDVGHCAFTVEEQEQAFTDLVTWVEAGMQPAGDDVLDADTVAQPDYGCRFSTSGHNPAFLAACAD
ncbi:prolyl oligopeptidase family serine peptidase [Ectothiorhodospiraceae bacterium WFHF3C12]|nr:prolyl oligopeptidase family serine peptidase [Ectothiorhodospiraceae bacterium WFHF3C12]